MKIYRSLIWFNPLYFQSRQESIITVSKPHAPRQFLFAKGKFPYPSLKSKGWKCDTRWSSWILFIRSTVWMLIPTTWQAAMEKKELKEPFHRKAEISALGLSPNSRECKTAHNLTNPFLAKVKLSSPRPYVHWIKSFKTLDQPVKILNGFRVRRKAWRMSVLLLWVIQYTVKEVNSSWAKLLSLTRTGAELVSRVRENRLVILYKYPVYRICLS